MSITKQQRAAIDYLSSKHGLPEFAAVGIVASLSGESGHNLNATAVGDGGKAYGIAQWHPDRQANFRRFKGKDIRSSTPYDQLDFVVHELQTTESGAYSKIKKANSAEGVAAAFTRHYERPLDKAGESSKRANIASRIGGAYGAAGNTGDSGFQGTNSQEQSGNSRSRDTGSSYQFDASKYMPTSRTNSSKQPSSMGQESAPQFDVSKYMPKGYGSTPKETTAPLLSNNGSIPKYDPNMTDEQKYQRIALMEQKQNAGLAKEEDKLKGYSNSALEAATARFGGQTLNSLGNASTLAGKVIPGATSLGENLKGRASNIESVYNKPGFEVGDVGAFVGDVAPALAVPLLRASSTLSPGVALAGNTALQAASGYALANDEDRALAGGLAGGVTVGAPVLGKLIGAAGRGLGRAGGAVTDLGDLAGASILGGDKLAGRELAKNLTDAEREALSTYISSGSKLSPIEGISDTTQMVIGNKKGSALNSLLTAAKAAGGTDNALSAVDKSNREAFSSYLDTLGKSTGISSRDAASDAATSIKSNLNEGIQGARDLASRSYKDPSLDAIVVKPPHQEVLSTWDKLSKTSNGTTKYSNPTVDTAIRALNADELPFREYDSIASMLKEESRALGKAGKTGEANAVREVISVVESKINELDDTLNSALKHGRTATIVKKELQDSDVYGKLYNRAGEEKLGQQELLGSQMFNTAQSRGLLDEIIKGRAKTDFGPRIAAYGKGYGGVYDLAPLKTAATATLRDTTDNSIIKGAEMLEKNKGVMSPLLGQTEVEKLSGQLDLFAKAVKDAPVSGSNTANKLQFLDKMVESATRSLWPITGAAALASGGLLGAGTSAIGGYAAKKGLIDGAKSKVVESLIKAGVSPTEAAKMIAKAEKRGIFRKTFDKLSANQTKINTPKGAVVSQGLLAD